MSETKVSGNFFEDIADEAIMAILTFHVSSQTLIYHNKMARMMFELSAETRPGTFSLQRLFPHDARGDFKPFSEAILQHEGFYQDILLQKANGTLFVGNVGVRKIDSDNGYILLLMVQDITLQKKLQRDITSKQVEIRAAYEELLKQNRQLRDLDIAKNRFIALTTHELRTPLAAMIAAAEILKLKLYDSVEQEREFVDMIYDQGQHLQALVNDILDLAKIQAGKMDYFVQEQDLRPLIESVVESFRGMAETSEVELSMIPAPENIVCYFDELRLRQIVSNLVNNAIKYNRPKGTVQVHLEDYGDVVRIYIQDTGPGIAADKLESIFNEFETIGSFNVHHKGTGLGLPISRRLMEGMGGKVQVDSEEGKGSIFWVDVPKTKVLPEDLYRPRPESVGDLAA